MGINLKTLISKLNETTRIAATRAAGICVGLGQYEVDIEHLFLALLEQTKSDFVLISLRCGIDAAVLESDLRAEIDRFKTGNSRTPVFSPHLSTLFEQAWLIASLDIQDGNLSKIRSSHLLMAALTEPSLAQLVYRGSKLFTKLKLDAIKHDLGRLLEGSQEYVAGNTGNLDESDEEIAVGDAVGEMINKVAPSKTPALDQFTTNLTQLARDGKIDPVIGRDQEIRQAIDILMRRRQNNPILTGEAGVGKTAVVEGLARRIAQNDVPRVLLGAEIHALDMSLLQAGASVKGEFENRLKNVIDEVKKSPHSIILFIDEAHTMIGAGGQAGQNDAANLLKPALARGELRTIAATTWSEYKKYFEKDAALARRFQLIKIEEPSEELACAMLRGMVPLMERHFNVRVYDEAITEAVRLSHRYISGRQLPDKAISLLDTACAKVALGQNVTPHLIENLAKNLERMSAEIASLEREACSGSKHTERLQVLHEQCAQSTVEHKLHSTRWEKEKNLAEQIKKARTTLEERELSDFGKSHAIPISKDKKRVLKEVKGGTALQKMLDELKTLQGENPLVPVQVDGQVVADIVANWTGIPLGKMMKDDIKTVLNLKNLLQERVLGQSHAIETIAQHVRTSRANLNDPNKPKGVFLFVGPSGVGKTETALALADVLYGGERKLVTINMSEYQEAHSISGLKGSPPGYVGYGEGGVLTEAVRRNPYSVVLLDEVEKAHPDVLELFFQVFDKGVLDDAEGREVDFKNTTIILTSNVASSSIMQACLNKEAKQLPTPANLEEMIRPQLVKAFKPAFLGRLRVIPYYPIPDDVLVKIIQLKLERIQKRIEENHKADFSCDETLVEAVLLRCTEVDSGARNVDNILNGSLLPEIAETVLLKMAEGACISRIKVSATKQGQFKYAIK
jgi:type VI secretion system protein VasG